MALQARYHLCAAGWLDGQRVGYPTAFSSPNCGAGYVGIVDYGRRVNLSETWDVFCYREKGENGHLSLTAKGSSSPVLSTFGRQEQGDPKPPRKGHRPTLLSVFVHSRGELHLQARLRGGWLFLQWEPAASADVLPHAHKLPGGTACHGHRDNWAVPAPKHCHRFIEPPRLKKTSKIIQSNYPPTTSIFPLNYVP